MDTDKHVGMIGCGCLIDRRFLLGCLFGGLSSVAALWITRRTTGADNLLLLDSVSEKDVNGENSFQAAGRALLQWIVTYRTKHVKDLPVISKVKPNFLCEKLPASAPETTESWTSIITDLNTAIMPGLTNWESSSKFFAYFKPHASYPAVLGELLCAGLNVMGFDWIASPSCTELEVIVLDWLAKFLNLPTKFYNLKEGPGNIYFFHIYFVCSNNEICKLFVCICRWKCNTRVCR
jgi:hypothetical protein